MGKHNMLLYMNSSSAAETLFYKESGTQTSDWDFWTKQNITPNWSSPSKASYVAYKIFTMSIHWARCHPCHILSYSSNLARHHMTEQLHHFHRKLRGWPRVKNKIRPPRLKEMLMVRIELCQDAKGGMGRSTPLQGIFIPPLSCTSSNLIKNWPSIQVLGSNISSFMELGGI